MINTSLPFTSCVLIRFLHDDSRNLRKKWTLLVEPLFDASIAAVVMMTASWIDHAIEAALPRDLIEEAALTMDREVDVVAMTMDTTIITTITEVEDLTQTISLATLLAPTMTTTQQVNPTCVIFKTSPSETYMIAIQVVAILLSLHLQVSHTLLHSNGHLPTPSIL